MKFQLRLFREDKQQWAYADVEIDDALLSSVVIDKSRFLADELVPYLEAVLELK